MSDAEFGQGRLPSLQVCSVCACERDVVEPDASLIERFGVTVGELMEPHQGLAHGPHDMPKRSRVFIENRRSTEEPFIPWDAAV